MAPTTDPTSLPPPDPRTAASGRPPTTTTGPDRPERRSWRERLPEVVGGIGTVLVTAAVLGFLSATWSQLDRPGRALVLGAAAAGLTAAAAWLEERTRSGLGTITSMLWLSGTATTTAAVLLAVSVPLDDAARLTALVAGLAGAAHGALALRRDPHGPLRQLGVVGPLLVAAGWFGTALADRPADGLLEQLLLPVAGLVDLGLSSDDYLLTGPAHLLLGVAWLLWSTRTTGPARHLASVGGTALVGYAALQLHVLPQPIGAFVALLVVLSYLVHGLVAERGGLVAVGAAGVLVAGGRVLWALFSGEVAVTVAAFTVGLALLTWAVRARSAAPTDDVADRPDVAVTSDRAGEPADSR